MSDLCSLVKSTVKIGHALCHLVAETVRQLILDEVALRTYQPATGPRR